MDRSVLAADSSRASLALSGVNSPLERLFYGLVQAFRSALAALTERRWLCLLSGC